MNNQSAQIKLARLRRHEALRRFRGFQAFCGDLLSIVPSRAILQLHRAGELAALVPDDWPDPVPEGVPSPFPFELVEPRLIALRAIPHPEERARAILAQGTTDRCPRSRELIVSVRDAGWPGAIAQTRLRPTPDEEAEAARAEDYRCWLASESRRIRRSMKTHSPALLREAQMRAFPAAFATRAQFGPSLLDVLEELGGRQGARSDE